MGSPLGRICVKNEIRNYVRLYILNKTDPKSNRSTSMKKPNCSPGKIPTKMPKSKLPSVEVKRINTDIPPKKERKGPVPPPNYTLEELLSKVPEPTTKVPKPDFSGEVDTGPPVGEEVW